MKIIACPHCEMKYRIDPAKFQQPQVRIRCKNCGEAFTADVAAEEPAQPPAPQPAPEQPAERPASPPPQPSPPQPSATTPATEQPAAATGGGGGTVLVAHDSDEVRASMEEILQEAGFTVVSADNGVDALMIIEQQKPQVAVLDVALPKMFGFEVCEVVRRDEELDGVKMLLIAAIYDATRYKRSPTSLYGADDYIEKHHIPDSLSDKVQRLVGGDTSPDAREEESRAVVPPEEEARQEAQRQQIRAAEDAPPKPATTEPTAEEPAAKEPAPEPSAPAPSDVDPEKLERARRLARTIVSDIALYNQESIEEGVKNGNLRELLADELDEGQQLLDGRLDDDVKGTEPFLETALNQLIETKQKEYGIDS